MAKSATISSDDSARKRIVRLLLLLLEQPNTYTKERIKEILETTSSTLDADMHILRSLDIDLRCGPKPHYRYSILPSKKYSSLNHLLHFSQDELEDLYRAVDTIPISDKRKGHLKERLSNLYNFKRLGYPNLRTPNLDKIDQLQRAINEQKQAVLVKYASSNGNTITDRHVEPFKIDFEHDTVHTYDLDKHVINHFKISRATSIQVQENAPWQYKKDHVPREIDPFGIVNNHQVNIHLRLKIGAYNELLERFPATRRHLLPSGDTNYHDFQCMVNADYKGLTNFILGYYHQGIEIIEDAGLRAALRKAVADMDF